MLKAVHPAYRYAVSAVDPQEKGLGYNVLVKKMYYLCRIPLLKQDKMKKYAILSVLAALFMIAVPAKAQFGWGVEGGLTLSKMHLSKDLLSSDNRAGWFIGPKIQAKLPLLGLGVDASLLYSQKYMSLEGQTDDGDRVSSSKTMPYVEIPVNVKWNFGMSSIVGVYVATGPQWSWYLGGKTLSWNNENVGVLEDSNFSWNVGCGINALKHLQLGVSYNIALGKTGEFSAENVKLRNNSWQVRLAYIF